MKRFILAFALCLPFFCANIGYSTNSKAEMVYICTGPKSKVYHKSSNCKGLNSCSREINKVTLDKAKSMNRRACKICY